MRYLDRAPKPTDRVEVTYVGEYRMIGIPGSREHAVWARTSVGTMSAYVVPDTATIRVIAPEPAVGDVVTEDMDLPEGSLVERLGAGEGVRHRVAVRVSTSIGMQWDLECDWHSNESLLSINGPWRIVRIGGTP